MTVIELMIALMVLTVAVAGLAYTGTVGMVDTSYATQRQAATGLANQAIEQIRALPFSVIAAGLSSSDPTLSTDPNITTTTSGASTLYWFNKEEIPVSTSSTNVAPLDPHQVSGVRVGTNTYTVSVYITYAQPPNSAGAPSSNQVFRATAIVTWVNPERHALIPQVQNQTLIYSPTGCESNSTHPYTSPCQPFFYANASAIGGSEVVNGPGGQSPVPGIANLAQVSLFPTNDRSEAQLEQVQSVRSYAQTTSGLITYSDGTAPQDASSQAASAAASNDATSSLGAYQSANTSQSTSAVTATASGSPASVVVSPSPSDTGSAVATVSAGQPTSNSCSNLAGTPLTTGQPCGTASADQTGSPATLAIVWTSSGPSGLGNPILASIGVPPQKSTAVTERDTAAGSTTCTQVPANTDGCIHAAANRSLGTVDIGELPSGIGPLPAGWNLAQGLVELSGFSDTVSAEAGVGAGSPSASVTSGTVSYWNGTGYTNVPADTTPGSTIPAQPVTVDDPSYPGGAVTITITPNLTFGGSNVSDPATGCTTPCTRTNASATSTSPIQGTIEYQVTYNGVTIVDALLAVNLGTLSSSAIYQQAPSSAP